jgi:hypothetical protein
MKILWLIWLIHKNKNKNKQKKDVKKMMKTKQIPMQINQTEEYDIESSFLVVS